MVILGGVLIWKRGKQAIWKGGAKTFSLLFLCIWIPIALSVPDSLWFKKSLSTARSPIRASGWLFAVLSCCLITKGNRRSDTLPHI